MLNLNFNKTEESSFRILCLGSHSDDIEIGCGGTIIKLMENLSNVDLLWVVFSAGGVRKKEAQRSASLFSNKAHQKDIRTLNFRDSFFPYQGLEIKEYFETIKEFNPDLIFTHYHKDHHQDHRLVSELTSNTFRNNMILEYEIPKYDGDLGSPNIFVNLDEKYCQKKIELILDCFTSQLDNHWFSDETFRSIMRLRGIQCNSSTGYAESFYGRKISINCILE